MRQPDRGEITRILQRIEQEGSERDDAIQRLFEVAYEELRALASQCMRRERPDHTLQPTALVHEAYLRLVGDASLSWQSRAHFFGTAARAMRQILVEQARRRNAKKHGGGVTRVTLDESIAAPSIDATEVLALEEALNRLAERKARLAQVVELRIFGGLTVPDVAEVLGIGERTVHEDWTFACLWLAEQLGGSPES